MTTDLNVAAFENHVLWVCDCQSARVRAAADGDFTAIIPAGTCGWCGRTYQQVNRDNAERADDA